MIIKLHPHMPTNTHSHHISILHSDAPQSPSPNPYHLSHPPKLTTTTLSLHHPKPKLFPHETCGSLPGNQPAGPRKAAPRPGNPVRPRMLLFRIISVHRGSQPRKDNRQGLAHQHEPESRVRQLQLHLLIHVSLRTASGNFSLICSST